MNNKAADDKRRIMIKSYLSTNEKEHFDLLKSRYGAETTQAEFIRWAIFDKKIDFNFGSFKQEENIDALLFENKKIGVNLNQIAKILNAQMVPDNDLIILLNQQLKLLREVESSIKEILQAQN